MPDFFDISTRTKSNGVMEISPTFIVGSKTKDLMIRGQDFYAVWNDEIGLWSRDEDEVIRQVDNALNQVREKQGTLTNVKYMWDGSTGSIDKWHKYVQKQMRDNFHLLDTKVTFSDTVVKKEDYISKKLPYSLSDDACPSYEELISTLYDPEEREKFEWLIGSIFAGDSKDIQKFCVFHGDPGTGKSTVLNIIQMLFEGYWSVIDFKEMTSFNNQFALELLGSNPLVVIQHDADLSKISDATMLNSLVSHETMSVNEKFRKKYQAKFNAILFIGTNRYVKIPEAKSGIIRRLLDIYPTGNKVTYNRYRTLTKNIKFELGAIANHCLKLYLERGPEYYNEYIPTKMISATNELYDFVEDVYFELIDHDPIDLNTLYNIHYKNYCARNDIRPKHRMDFKREIGNYYKNTYPEKRVDGMHRRNVYEGFIKNKFSYTSSEQTKEQPWLILDSTRSMFDEAYAEQKAQYAKETGEPKAAWKNVRKTLQDLDTSKLHYILLPEENHIVIDFDIKNASGMKDKDLNYEAALKFPPTYAEYSQGGAGIHLHYFYDGDVSKLARTVGDEIEIKTFPGLSALRRRLSYCNDIPMATISSGLPLKGEKPMINQEGVKNEKHLRAMVNKALRKEVHANTAPNIDFIKHVMDEAYAGDFSYDIRDMREAIIYFAMDSTHQSQRCMELVGEMKFTSRDLDILEGIPGDQPDENAPMVFYDIEVYPNLFIICWKKAGNSTVVRMINPEPKDILPLYQYKLIGFNNRRYDNHIIFARATLGYTIPELFSLSQGIVTNRKNVLIGQAYNLSYADVYDFASKKQSLKKWEIDLDIHHQEMSIPWDEPVPEEMWEKVADYCCNDVIATEVTFNHLHEDFNARKILAELSGLTVNDTTRQHATKIIFGNERKPALIYTDLSEMFPGYSFERGVSSYMGENPSEGGYVHAEEGIYGNVAVLDIASMHPTSILALNLFGEYTPRFKDIVDARLAIKRRDKKAIKTLLGGVLEKYTGSEEEMDALAYALKIIINSVYGFTAATFPNPFKDPRNKDNIVAKRGALFMITLMKEVQKRGYIVAHIKTDSIKIPDADEDIIGFVMDFGQQYGYTFEHESTYDKFCLVNDAVYIAKYRWPEKKEGEWDATGAEFQHPYIFKTLFSHEPIEFRDLWETKSVSTALYLDMNEDLGEDEHNYVHVGRVGAFVPIKPGCGGGLLLREKEAGKYSAATGTKGWRWLEAEVVKSLGKEDDIDYGYFDKLVEDAKKHIEQYTDFDWFVGEAPYNQELPFHEKMNPPVVEDGKE